MKKTHLYIRKINIKKAQIKSTNQKHKLKVQIKSTNQKH